jgi:hypothetical protein
MNELRIGFEAAGVKRNWKLKDMVLEIDLDNKRIISVVPTDGRERRSSRRNRKSRGVFDC